MFARVKLEYFNIVEFRGALGKSNTTQLLKNTIYFLTKTIKPTIIIKSIHPLTKSINYSRQQRPLLKNKKSQPPRTISLPFLS